MKAGRSLEIVAEELRQLELARDAAIERAFGVLEAQHAAIAHLAVQLTGDRQRAARWMSMHQRAFDGRLAYDLLAEGDLDTVCDQLSPGRPTRATTLHAGGVY